MLLHIFSSISLSFHSSVDGYRCIGGLKDRNDCIEIVMSLYVTFITVADL